MSHLHEGRNSTPIGTAGIFDRPEELVRAAGRVREAGYRRWDCYTPYPVRDLDRAMGLKPSPLPGIALGAGFAGAAATLGFQWWTSVIDYPLRTGGKPFFSWPAFVPVIFEVFVLASALALMAGLFYFCRLGKWHSPLPASGLLPEATGSRFVLMLEAEDPLYSPPGARRLLEDAGCREIRLLDAGEGEGGVR